MLKFIRSGSSKKLPGIKRNRKMRPIKRRGRNDANSRQRHKTIVIAVHIVNKVKERLSMQQFEQNIFKRPKRTEMKTTVSVILKKHWAGGPAY